MMTAMDPPAGGRGRSRVLQGASFWGTSPDADSRRRAAPACLFVSLPNMSGHWLWPIDVTWW